MTGLAVISHDLPISRCQLVEVDVYPVTILFLVALLACIPHCHKLLAHPTVGEIRYVWKLPVTCIPQPSLAFAASMLLMIGLILLLILLFPVFFGLVGDGITTGRRSEVT